MIVLDRSGSMTGASSSGSPIAKMDAALGETLIIGVDTLIPLHRAIMNETDFRNREVNVEYLDGHPGLLDGR